MGVVHDVVRGVVGAVVVAAGGGRGVAVAPCAGRTSRPTVGVLCPLVRPCCPRPLPGPPRRTPPAAPRPPPAPPS